MYDVLNRSDIGVEDARYPAEIWRRVLRHLGDYTAQVVRTLNVRPREVRLLEETRSYVTVRVSTNVEHLVLKLVPEGSIAAEVYCYRAMGEQQVPAPRVIHHDATGSLVPCPYTLTTYVGGVRAAQLDDQGRLRVAARQVGRALRRLHRSDAAGWGQPLSDRRWSATSWRAALAWLHNETGAAIYTPLLLNEAQWATFKGATFEQEQLDIEQPQLIHGGLRPERVFCTPGEHVQLEALVDPGPLVGGDPMYDLAWGLLPCHAAAFREGLLEGYSASAPLTPAEQRRLDRLLLLVSFWETCRQYAHGEDHTSLLTTTPKMLEG